MVSNYVLVLSQARGQTQLKYWDGTSASEALSFICCNFKIFLGFRVEYPGGGIYRHQLEQMTGNVVMNVIFK